MEGRLVMHNIIPFSTQARQRDLNRGKQCLSIVSVLTQPVNDQVGKLSSSKPVYKDNFFELVAINYISKIVQASTGSLPSFSCIMSNTTSHRLLFQRFTNNKSGYDSFVEAATGLWSNFNPVQQHEIVAKTLDKAIPRPILAMASSSFSSHRLLILTYIRTLLPDSKFTRELFAVFTTLCFAWLIGPNEVRESELDGRRERNVVHIKKCRFLEESNCVGMCINLCKMPSQKFMKDALGVPVIMVPNFDDMSCEMVFGQEPPATAEDPAFKQPCYKLWVTPILQIQIRVDVCIYTSGAAAAANMKVEERDEGSGGRRRREETVEISSGAMAEAAVVAEKSGATVLEDDANAMITPNNFSSVGVL
ncbi:hypothetical protein C3L33_04139, partial [Rhododendron williamsianum]